MTISGILFTLARDPESADAAQRTLREDQRLTLGERFGASLPAVLEAADDYESKRAVEALSEMPGVTRVDVVFVQLDDVQAAGCEAGGELGER